MEVKATLETRVSKKGNEYQVLVIKLTNNYEKLVFLDKAEIELLKQADEKINIGLSQYINNNISKETLALERQEKVAKLKELYEKGEYKGPEAKELAKSLVEGINDEIVLARNTILFDDEE